MKTPMVLLLLVLVAGATGVAVYQIVTKEATCKTTFCLTIPKGTRVHFKDIKQVETYKLVLQGVDAGGTNGTDMNIRYEDGHEEEGPKPTPNPGSVPFPPAQHPIGPAGSMHNTQRVTARTIQQLEAVLSFFEGSSITMSAANVTPTPTP